MLSSSVKKLLLGVILFITAQFAYAQEKVEMADGLRSNGKIYVVVAVLVIIFIGLFLFLINIDRKVSKLEKESQKHYSLFSHGLYINARMAFLKHCDYDCSPGVQIF